MAHVVLCHHRALELREVVAVAFTRFVKVALIPDQLCKGVYSEGGGHPKVLMLYSDLLLRL